MRYGKIDFDYALDLAGRAPENDGPIYMVNFMKYRDVAGYELVFYKCRRHASSPDLVRLRDTATAVPWRHGLRFVCLARHIAFRCFLRLGACPDLARADLEALGAAHRSGSSPAQAWRSTA